MRYYQRISHIDYFNYTFEWLITNQVMVHGLLTEGTREVLSIGRWKEQVIAPEFLLEDRDDVSEGNRNAFLYEDKHNFRPEGFSEVKRVTGEDIDLQPRLVTRVRCIISKNFSSVDFFCEQVASLHDIVMRHVSAKFKLRIHRVQKEVECSPLLWHLTINRSYFFI